MEGMHKMSNTFSDANLYALHYYVYRGDCKMEVLGSITQVMDFLKSLDLNTNLTDRELRKYIIHSMNNYESFQLKNANNELIELFLSKRKMKIECRLKHS